MSSFYHNQSDIYEPKELGGTQRKSRQLTTGLRTNHGILPYASPRHGLGTLHTRKSLARSYSERIIDTDVSDPDENFENIIDISDAESDDLSEAGRKQGKQIELHSVYGKSNYQEQDLITSYSEALEIPHYDTIIDSESDESARKRCYCANCRGAPPLLRSLPEPVIEVPLPAPPELSKRAKKYIKKYPSLGLDLEEYKLKYDNPTPTQTEESFKNESDEDENNI